MANFNDIFKLGKLIGDGKSSLSAPKIPIAADGKGSPASDGVPLGTFDDQELLTLWNRIKKEALDERWVFERQWHRNILYTLGRQWIEYYQGRGGWKDKRMASWIPRPVTNKCKETVQAIRAMFASIKLGVNARPQGSDPVNVSAAAVADELAPVLHDSHNMDANMTEFDFWLLVTGNAFLHTFLDYDIKYGELTIKTMQCQHCGAQYPETQSQDGSCPTCGAPGPHMQAMDEMGQPAQTYEPKGMPVTIPLSPLEMAFPNSYPRFEEVPYVVRLRWRPKSFFENREDLAPLVSSLSFQKAPSDQSLSLFKSLASHNDLGIAPAYLADGTSSSQDSEEGLPEYEVWYKPCAQYPDGLVFRIIGDKDPKVLHLEDTESLPGPFPYKDASGKPLFPFTHAGYEHVGGRILASGPLDVIIQKQDQVNQLDSMIQLIIQRMSNPVWLEPKGAEIEKLTGMPGLIVKWNPLTVGGNAKPERIDGTGPHQSLFAIREQYLKDIEELAGTFDIVKGAKPTGVEAFSAMQLLVERSQARFASVFSSRGKAYRDWYQFAIELERVYGPDERTKAILTPARKWQFQNFKRAQLSGAVTIVIEDGSNAPKTSLGMRAALEHANQLGMLNMQDPDQRYEGLKLFGLTRLAPTLDIHVQAALQKQAAFEQWAMNPQMVQQSFMQTQQRAQELQQQAATAQTPEEVAGLPQLSMNEFNPLKWRKWYDPQIHRQEFLKWANGDTVRELIQMQPQLAALLEAHLSDIDMAGMQLAMQQAGVQAPSAALVPGAKTPGGAAMANSNNESTKGNEPKGHGQGAQNHGPA